MMFQRLRERLAAWYDPWWEYYPPDRGVGDDELVLLEGPAHWRAAAELGNRWGCAGWLVLTDQKLVFTESSEKAMPWASKARRVTVLNRDILCLDKAGRWTDLIPVTGKALRVTTREGVALRFAPVKDSQRWFDLMSLQAPGDA